MIKIYCARAMTGRNPATVLAESRAVRDFVDSLNAGPGPKIVLLDPVAGENIDESGEAISPALVEGWIRDKKMIRESHVLIDFTGPIKSEGVLHEIGFHRYSLWKPVIRVWPGLLNNRISWMEDDLIVQSAEYALVIARAYWGTWYKRLVWRLSILNRSLPRWIWDQILAFK